MRSSKTDLTEIPKTFNTKETRILKTRAGSKQVPGEEEMRCLNAQCRVDPVHNHLHVCLLLLVLYVSLL